MTLDLRIATRPEVLADVLADRLAAPSADPFVPDLVVVPNAGMREWVATRLLDRLRVLSGVEFVFPAELTRRTLGLPAPEDDPWRPERMAWHVLALMAEGADLGRTPWEGMPTRPWSVARRVADLLEGAASQRPDLVGAWRAGEDGAALGAARGWQAVTWRALRERIGVPSPAERLLAVAGGDAGSRDAGARDAGADADAGPAVGGSAAGGALPERLTVFGLSALSGPAAAVLVEASRHSDVLVLATTAAGSAVREALAERGSGAGPALLVAPPRPSEVRQDTHPLLAAWGTPALEAATMLARLPVAATLDEGTSAPEVTTQLRALQAAVHAGTPSERAQGGDGSVQVHACHGTARQLEVLRDALLHLLEADPTLLPRDIAVLCADLEAVAPLAEPILGADVGGRHLPVLVTDRAATTAPPVQAALDAALALATSRLEREEVLTLLSLPVVAAALGLEADDLALLERLADDLDVRWGRDATHRERWGYPAGVHVGTWRETLDRILAGLLLDADEPPAAGIAPAAGLGMQDLERVGRLADALDAVAHLAGLGDPATGARPMAAWAGPLRWIVDTLLRPRRSVDPATHAFAGEAAQVREVVDGLVADAEAAAATTPLDVREVRAALADRLSGGGSRARLRTGHVSVASLAPLRGVPFRVVALVGVGDTVLSVRGADDDDVLASEQRLGERDAAGERRAALLDAVLAARDALIVTCDGQDVRTGRTLELPTVVEELLDALPPVPEGAARVGSARAGAARAGAPLVVRHPRHLADRRNLGVGPGTVDRVDPSRPWTFAPAALRALTAIEEAEGDGRPGPGAGVLTASVDGGRWRSVPLPAPPAPAGPTATSGALVELRLEDVVEALQRPARVLLRERLGVRLPRELVSDPRTIELAVEDPLARWAIGQDLLAHLAAGGAPAEWVAMRPARGGLPPGRLGRAVLDGFVDEASALHEAAGEDLEGPPATLPVGVELDVPGPDGATRVRLVGAVDHRDGTIVDVRYSRDHPGQVVAAGVGLLAALAQGGADTPVTAARVVRRPASSKDVEPAVHALRVAGDAAAQVERARGALTDLVDLALRVRRGPAALLPRAAWSIDASTDLRRAPGGSFADDVARDLDDPALQVVLGVHDLAELADQEHGPLEVGLPDAPTPVQRWSLALCGPLRDPFAAVAPAGVAAAGSAKPGAAGEGAS